MSCKRSLIVAFLYHRKGEPLPEEIALAVKASIGKPTNGQPGFQIGVNIELFHSSFSSVLPDTTDAERLLTAAHQFVCLFEFLSAGASINNKSLE